MNLRKILTMMVVLSLPFGAWAAPKVKISAQLSSPVVLEKQQERNFLKISLTGFEQAAATRVPINLALVIDRSTSMHGDRIARARDAAVLAINMLNEEDTLSVIAYDSGVSVLIPAIKVNDKAALIRILERELSPRGMTALFAGVSKGLGEVTKHLNRAHVNRIILLSDGQANTGPTSIKELSDLAKMAAKKGISITTIGLGNDYNERLMTAIAGYSDGNHAYISDPGDLEAAFAHEFKDVMSVVAQEVEVTIKLHGRAKALRLLGREGSISQGNLVKVRLNQLYSNQEKYVLLELEPEKGTNREEKKLADVEIQYDNLNSLKKDTHAEVVKIRYSDSLDAVEKANIAEVMIDTAIQYSTIAEEQALELYRDGKAEAAQEVMREASSRLDRISNAPAVQNLSGSSAPIVRKKLQQREMKVKEKVDLMEDKQAAPEMIVKEMAEDIYLQKNQIAPPVPKKGNK